MTVLKGKQIQSFLASPDPGISGILIYGPDRGRVRERARQIVTSVLGEEDDPFCLTELGPANLSSDPALLRDELMAIPFLGNRKIVWLCGTDKNSENIIRKTIRDERTHQALLVIESLALKPSSALRKTFEQSRHLVSVACFEDNEKSLGQVLDDELMRMNQTISPEARTQLISQLGSDRALSRNEIEKLCLYAGKGQRIELTDIEAISGDTSSLTMDMIADNVGSGNVDSLDKDYQRAISSGIQPTSILLNVTRHLSCLHFVLASAAQGQSRQSLLLRLRPPVHFKRKDAFARQLNRWSEPQLRKALGLLRESELQSRTGHADPATLVNRALLQISTLASPRRG